MAAATGPRRTPRCTPRPRPPARPGRRPTGGRSSPTPTTSTASATGCSTPTPPGCCSAGPSSGRGAMVGPLAQRPRRARSRPAPANDRLLADRMVWQYPWYWSAGVLGGLWLLSVFVLIAAREVAGPAEMTPIIEFDGVSKWYGNVIGLNKLTLHIPAGRHRPARPERRRQVDAPATGHRPAPAEPGHGPRPRPARLGQPGPQPPHRPVPGAGRLLRVDDRPRLRPHLRPPERAGPARGDATAADRAMDARRHDRAHEPGDPRLLEGHAAADQAGPGAGPRAATCCSSTSRSPAPTRSPAAT